MILKDKVIVKIREALARIGPGSDDLPITLEYARDEKFGDYACTAAMDKNVRENFRAVNPEFANPRKFAQALSDNLAEENKKSGLFEKIEIAGPGFINITVSPGALFEYVREACLSPKTYGRSKTDSPRKIIFEFVSANPTGPLNVVSARSAALGDSCCNLLEAAGENVYREYYVNNYGNQADLLGQSCLLRHLESKGAVLKFSKKRPDGTVYYEDEPGLPFPAEGYHGEYLTDITAELMRTYKKPAIGVKVVNAAVKLSKKNDVSENWLTELKLAGHADRLSQAATAYFLEAHRADLEKFRVRFDNFFGERGLHENGAVLAAREAVKAHVYEEDGKAIFRSTDFGDDKDRVIVRDDGRPTYLLADIAYHRTKIERGFTHIFNIWGPDHHGYIKRLAGAVQAMGHPAENFRVLIAQQVNLLENGAQIVMSKRTGKFITLETLLEEIPPDVSRYFFVMRSFESHLDFDLAQARDTSDKNPYYYVAYSHARIRSIFGKATELGLAPLDADAWRKTPEPELTPERRRLLWFAARFPEEVRDAAQSMEPHRLIAFLYQLASALARFYGPRENKIIEQDPQVAAVLLSVLDAVAVCLKNGLGLLGMEAPERMDREDAATLPEP